MKVHTEADQKKATVLAWQRKCFREHWNSLGRTGHAGRGAIDREVRRLNDGTSRSWVNRVWPLCLSKR